MKKYFTRVVKLWQENRLYSILMVFSIALIITFCMVLYMVNMLQTGDIGPERNRSRILYSDQGHSFNAETNSDYNSGMSSKVARFLFSDIEGIEEVSFTLHKYTKADELVGTSEENSRNRRVKYVDDAFFRIYSYEFVEGEAFTKEQSDAARNEVIITDKLAMALYGTTSVLNKTLLIDFQDYRIVGVVKSVSSLYNRAYGEVWKTFDSAKYDRNDQSGGVRGRMEAILMLKKGVRREVVQRQISERLDELNANIKPYTFEFGLKGVNDLGFTNSSDVNNWKIGDANAINISRLLILLGLIILAIPAISMAGIISSQISKRSSEIGVRKAYGATNIKVLWLFFSENFFLTIIGGLIGIFFSVIALEIFKQALIGNVSTFSAIEDFDLPWQLLFSPSVFLVMLLFCLIVNILSTIIPVSIALKTSITNALKSA